MGPSCDPQNQDLGRQAFRVQEPAFPTKSAGDFSAAYCCMRTTGTGNDNARVGHGWDSIIVLRRQSEEGFTNGATGLGGRRFCPGLSRSGLVLNAQRALVGHTGLS